MAVCKSGLAGGGLGGGGLVKVAFVSSERHARREEAKETHMRSS